MNPLDTVHFLPRLSNLESSIHVFEIYIVLSLIKMLSY